MCHSRKSKGVNYINNGCISFGSFGFGVTDHAGSMSPNIGTLEYNRTILNVIGNVCGFPTTNDKLKYLL